MFVKVNRTYLATALIVLLRLDRKFQIKVEIIKNTNFADLQYLFVDLSAIINNRIQWCPGVVSIISNIKYS